MKEFSGKESQKLFVVLLLLTVHCVFVYPQVKDRGNPVVINYSKKVYKASTQNWDIAQDQRGILYFANNDGLLEFDGAEWKIYHQQNGTIIRALAISKEGRIYAGSFNSIGYYFPNEKGCLVYHSLTERIDSANRDFEEEIWKIHEIGNAIYFQAGTRLFKYEKGSLQAVLSGYSFTLSFRFNDRMYIHEKNLGICLLEDNNKLVPLNGSDILKGKQVWALLPGINDQMILCTADNGLFIYDGKTIKEWNVPCNDFLKQNQIFSATVIDDSHFAFGTIQDGLLITDNRGFPLQHINLKNGLQNNTVLSVKTDLQRNLWLGLDNGIDYIKINSPVSYLNSKMEIGSGYCSAIHNGILYLGTNRGLFYKNWQDYINPLQPYEDFKLVEGSKGQVWGLTVYDNTLFCAHSKGTYSISGDKMSSLSGIPGSWKLITFRDKPDIIIGGTYSGLQLFRKNKSTGNWEFDKVIPGISESCREMEVDKNTGSIWISHGYKGIFRVYLNEASDSVISLNFYNSKNGLPVDFGLTVQKFKEEVVIASDSGFYYFDQQQKSFKPHNYLLSLLGKEKVYKLVPDLSGNIWFFLYDNPGVINLNYDGSYSVATLNYEEFRGALIHSFESLLTIDQHNFVISTEDGFLHFDPTFNQFPTTSLGIMIRQVLLKDNTILFGGNFSNWVSGVLSSVADRPVSQFYQINYRNNTLLFKFSSPDFENLSNIEFSYHLEGFEDKWSDWSAHSSKEYTNLREGKYTFFVKARNFRSYESSEASFKFEISPPWQRSGVAYVFYACFIIVLIYFLVGYYLSRIERENEAIKLEQKKQLKDKEEEFHRESSEARQEIIRLQNEKLEIENRSKQAEIENKSSELASFAMQITYKNEILNQVKNQLTRVSTSMLHQESKKQVLSLIKKLDKDIVQDDDWNRFEMHFDQVHGDFIKKLKNKYSQLTPRDLKLAAYLRMNLSTKEIAPLINISVRGVEISRYRLRKKIGIDNKENLVDFLMNFE